MSEIFMETTRSLFEKISSSLIGNKDIKVEFSDTHPTSTDFKKIYINTANIEKFKEIDDVEKYLMGLFLNYHEIAHNLYTSTETVPRLLNKYDKDNNVDMYIAKQLLNILEDLRIELALIADYSGLKKIRNFTNKMYYNKGKSNKEKSEKIDSPISEFFSAVWSYAFYQEIPELKNKKIKDIFKDKQVLDKIISSGYQKTSDDLLPIVYFLMEEIKDIRQDIKEDVERQKKMMEELKELLEELNTDQSVEEFEDNSEEPRKTKTNSAEMPEENNKESEDNEESDNNGDTKSCSSSKPEKEKGQNEKKDSPNSSDNDNSEESEGLEETDEMKENSSFGETSNEDEETSKNSSESEERQEQNSDSDISKGSSLKNKPSNKKKGSEENNKESLKNDKLKNEEKLSKEDKEFLEEKRKELEELKKEAEEEKKRKDKENEQFKENKHEMGTIPFTKGINKGVELLDLPPELPEEISEYDKDKYNSIKDKVNPYIKDFTKSIRKVITFRKNNTKIRNKNSGKLDNRNLYKYKTDKTDLFYRKRKDLPDLTFMLLVDGSGSMRIWENRDEKALEASIMFHEGLQTLNIKHALWSFATNYDSDRYNKPGYANEVVNQRHINFEDSLKPRFNYGIMNYIGDGENRDGFSIRIAAEELEKQREEKKIMFVISDGQPSHSRGRYSWYGENKALEDTKKAIIEAERKGITLVGISIGNQHNHIDYLYKNKIKVNNLKYLNKKIENVLKRFILS